MVCAGSLAGAGFELRSGLGRGGVVLEHQQVRRGEGLMTVPTSGCFSWLSVVFPERSGVGRLVKRI